MNPTREQLAVIESEERAFSVVASAGSGKTRVLVARYIRLVKNGVRPEQILCITYTRKAAGEMKQRIVSALMAEGMVDAAQECETGPIQTIHSFCERLLREHAFHAGLDPKFEVSAGAEQRMRFEAALKHVLENQIEENPAWIDFLRNRSGKSHYQIPTSLSSYLRKELTDVLEKVRGSNWELNAFRSAHSEPGLLLDQWKDAVCREAGVVWPTDSPVSALAAGIKGALKSTKSAPKWVSDRVVDENEEEAARESCALSSLAAAVWFEFERRMMQDQAFDFSLLERLAVNLMVENADVRDQVRRQFPVVLVDESQDINPVQFRLLQALESDSQVMIGDPQQSIFAFRLADREQFLKLINEPGKTTYWLTKNFRVKEPGILRFVDRVFGSLWGDAYRPMGEVSIDLDGPNPSMAGVELWPVPPKKNQAEIARNVRQLVEQGNAPNDIAILVRRNAFGISLQQELDALKVPNQLVGGNQSFFTRMEIHDLANALEALADPNDTLAVVSLLRGPFVGLSTDALFELALEPVTLERLRALEGRNSRDHERIVRFKEWFFDLIGYADRLSAWEVCAELFARTDYLAAIVGESSGLRTLANVRKLFTWATQQPEIGPAAFAAQIREVQRLRHQEPEAEQLDQDADAVKIMTVHKAKGLEFPIVVVPEFMSTSNKPFRGPAVDTRRQLLVAGKVGDYTPIVRRFVVDAHKRREAEEDERLFYVALTRAVNRLCLVIPAEADRSMASQAATGIGYPLALEPGVTVRSAVDSGS